MSIAIELKSTFHIFWQCCILICVIKRNLASLTFGAAECRDIKLVDAPVSGGVKRAAEGTLTV
jgi:3-hydroxyisobutyrate dehydrogenase-like beta-hydroxyacid dehydrogenase